MNSQTFLLEKKEDYKGLEVIDFASNIVLGFDQITLKAYYIYKTKEVEYCFHNLSEVCKPFLTWFENSLKRNGYKAVEIETFEVLISLNGLKS